jgi:hypothetical protein
VREDSGWTDGWMDGWVDDGYLKKLEKIITAQMQCGILKTEQCNRLIGCFRLVVKEVLSMNVILIRQGNYEKIRSSV